MPTPAAGLPSIAIGLLAALLCLAPASRAQTFSSVPASAPLSPVYADFGAGGYIYAVTRDSQGSSFLVGHRVDAASGTRASLQVTKLDVAGREVFRVVLGGAGGSSGAVAAAVDPSGNLVVVGSTSDPAFPVTNQLISRPTPAPSSGLVLKLNGTTGAVLFSTRLNGMGNGQLGNTADTGATAVAVDVHGDIYVAGGTSESDFLVSANAYQTTGGGPDGNLGVQNDGFVLKLSGAGDRILYSTYLHGASSACVKGGSSCLGRGRATHILAIAVDANGFATAVGSGYNSGFPGDTGGAFAARFNADASALLWGASISPPAISANTVYATRDTQATCIALTSTGDVVLAGKTTAAGLQTTSGAFQPQIGGYPLGNVLGPGWPQDTFVMKLNGMTGDVLFSTYLGGSSTDWPTAVGVDPQNQVWVTGSSYSTDFPWLPGSLRLGNDFVVGFTADGTRLIRSFGLPRGTANRSGVLSPDGVFTLVGSTGSVLQFPLSGPPANSVLGIVIGGDTAISPAVVSPGALISIYGVGIGPATPQGLQLRDPGQVGTVLGGTQVLFDGVAAPLLYAGSQQINLAVPFRVAGQASTVMQIVTPGASIAPLTLQVNPALPSLFRAPDGLSAAALNQDGTVNSQSNPAIAGSIVSLFGTGFGALIPPLGDGQIAPVATPLSVAALPVTALGGYGPNYTPVPVLYAGAAPGLVAGVMQVNVRVPLLLGNLLTLQVGSVAMSQAVTVWVK